MVLKTIKESFAKFKQKRRARLAGYSSIEEIRKAGLNGFLNFKAQLHLGSLGIQNPQVMIESWEETYFEVNSLLKSQAYLNIQMVKDTTNIEQINNIESYLQPYLRQLNQYIAEISKILADQIGIFKLFREENMELFTTLSFEQLKDQNLLFNVTYDNIIRIKEELVTEMQDKRQWYIGWQDYIMPLHLYHNEETLSLKQISNIISASLDEEQSRLLILLDEKKKLDYEISKHRYIERELGFQVLMLME